jgi:hypothetical protein
MRLPRLHLDPGIWERDGGGWSATIELGDCSLILEASTTSGVDVREPIQHTEIDGEPFEVAAYRR